ncbi:ABC transporter substrate-binding protein [Parasporobacterium paucivorans]|uniref:ABC-type Fe3+ transport system, substrate-binding protein n=1 Tax=Parasporobacterium paucivorans DSM 15970 TaxID=1122934 RepID=A0A1M6L9M6_9FIRM|nr:ABC transporter substrate-binding protein [Parasporobacterium paucivorans]SHJ67897.1 ABC-type Fe3+ transport system, substrate-binding protein [Parasporobacterium paucivorans DSM 15970]
MENVFLDIKDTLFNITEKHKDALDLLVSLGFEKLKDESMREVFGKSISLETALKLKKIDVQVFENQLMEKMRETKDKNGDSSIHKGSIKIVGVLPCPVRAPLTEGFEKWLNEQKFDFELDYEFKAASMGVDWLVDGLENKTVDELPDLFISAGFDIFFDKKLLGKFKADNLFEDITGIETYHEDFHNEYIQMEDPNRQYSIVGVVPAVFLINTDELKGRKIPSCWKDLLSEEFENSVSLPMQDFDLFNAILLNIYKIYGEEGVRKLGKSLQRSMHPAEMVKSHIKKQDRPAVTIMPYFFSWMAKAEGPMKAVWPEDGAIISPIFMLSKKEKKDKLKPIVDFLASKEVGEILAHNGRFPSVNPQVDNRIDKKNKYMWLGWNFIKEHDLSSLIKECEALFNSGAERE